MLKAYKYRIYPNKEQTELIEKTFGCCRFVYNIALETKAYIYSHFGVNRTAFGCSKSLKIMVNNLWNLTYNI